MNFESKPFFKHKGVEKLLEGRMISAALPFIERLDAETVISHALAFAQAVEDIAATPVSPRAQSLRSFFNELERISVHLEDLGNIAVIGAGYAPMQPYLGIRERLQQIFFRLSGNRYLRNLVIPGGLTRNFSDEEIAAATAEVITAVNEIESLFNRALRSDGLRDRLELVGILKKDAALVYGAVGLTARASGVDRDVRRDHPYAAYDRFSPRVLTAVGGDVFARFKLKMGEILESAKLIIDISSHLGEGSVKVPCHPELGTGIGAVEGGRGETIYVVTMKNGAIARAAIRSASAMNWPLLHELVPTNVLSDFPLCVRSLGLSVGANDL